MPNDPFLKRGIAIILLVAMLFTGIPFSFLGNLPGSHGKIVDESYLRNLPFSVPEASAAAKTKTIVFLIGSIVPTSATSTASAATSTYSFVITLPDIVPTTQPIRSAYIQYSAWENTTGAITASAFTLNKQGGVAQALTGPKFSTGGTSEQFLSVRLDATSAMQTLIGNASGTYAMTFTANLTGPSRIGEGAELYVTYDYDPLATTQINTVYQWVYSTSTQLSTTAITSASFNFNLPENTPTSTFSVAGSSTNQFWIEYRGFIPGGTNITTTVGWNAETTSTATFTQTTQEFSFLLLSQPKTAGISPNSANTFKMISSGANGISAPSAVAVVTYTFNFNASTKLRKTVQLLLMQSTSTAVTTTINTTTTVNIPETSPSSTGAFLLGRLAFTTSSNPGMNASMNNSGSCTFTTPTAITQGTASTRNSGYLPAIWNVGPSSTVNAAGNWTICSSFTRSAIANIPGLAMYLSYDYANTAGAGSRTVKDVSFLGASHMSTGTAFATAGINASITDASTTASYAWLDSEFDNNAAGSTNQVLTIGAGIGTNTYTFPARGSARRQGYTFSTTSTAGFSSNVSTTVQCSIACVNDAAYTVLGYADMTAANFTQAHYHWRNDGSESGATAAATEDTSTSTPSSGIIHLRVEISNAGDATSSAAFRLEYQKNSTSSSWIQLATSSVGTADWQMATSSQVADGTATTNIATSTGGTTDANIFFASGEVVASSSRNQSVNTVLTGTQFTEVEFVIRPTANAAAGVPYYFRVSNAGVSLTTYSVFPQITVSSGNSPPTISNLLLNGGSDIVLIPNATSSVTVTASTTAGTNAILFATSTIYRTALGPNCTADNRNCYQLASSSCSFSSNTSTVSCTAGIWYFANSTGNPSSSFPSDSWKATIAITDSGSSVATGTTSSGVNIGVLTAINITTSTITYGTIAPNSNTGSTNQTTTVQNAGNSSTTLKISGTALTKGASIIATSSQQYATSTFTFNAGSTSTALTDVGTTIPGFLLTSPTSTTNVASTLYWGVAVPVGMPTGTYSGTVTFTAAYSP